MSEHGRIVSIDQLGSEINKILNEIVSSDLQDQCGRIAYDVVKKNRPVIKQKAQANIDKKSKRRTYTSNFVSVPKKDTHGYYGAVLWNKQYTLSHLIEDPHALWPSGHTTNDYKFWKETEPLMNEEFSKRCREKVREVLRNL